ncbi:MAG: ABC transporter ATP-binding protein, partial [Clostridia bacterium]|nr:ABC transporter ATP-binding protein [Clostridia bacterium]
MQSKPMSKGLLRRFSALMQGSRSKYLGSMFAVLVAVLVSFVTPLLFAGTVDAVSNVLSGTPSVSVNLPQPFRAFYDARGGEAYLAAHIVSVAGILILINLIGGLFQYLRGKWSAEASEMIAERMRNRLYAHLMSMDFAYHAKAETGDLIQRCTLDVETVRRFLASQVSEVFRTVVMIVMALTLMSRIHVGLTLISLILIPPLFGLALWFFHWVQKLFAEADEADGKLSAMLQESLTGVRVVRAFARQQYESERFGQRIDDVHNKS